MTEASDLYRDDSDAEIERVCSLLESISKPYAEGSAELKALEDAALTFIVVRQNQALRLAFERLKRAFNGDLTVEIMARLREHGIEPDEFEENT